MSAAFLRCCTRLRNVGASLPYNVPVRAALRRLKMASFLMYSFQSSILQSLGGAVGSVFSAIKTSKVFSFMAASVIMSRKEGQSSADFNTGMFLYESPLPHELAARISIAELWRSSRTGATCCVLKACRLARISSARWALCWNSEMPPRVRVRPAV